MLCATAGYNQQLHRGKKKEAGRPLFEFRIQSVFSFLYRTQNTVNSILNPELLPYGLYGRNSMPRSFATGS